MCHPPDVLYRIGLAFTGLSTEVVREVTIRSDGWEVVGSDPLKAEALILKPCGDDGGENEPDKVEIALEDGEGGERERRESHEEGASPLRGGFICFFFLSGIAPRGDGPRSERNIS